MRLYLMTTITAIATHAALFPEPASGFDGATALAAIETGDPLTGCNEQGLVYCSCSWPDNGSGDGVRRINSGYGGLAFGGIVADFEGNVYWGGGRESSGQLDYRIRKMSSTGDAVWTIPDGVPNSDDILSAMTVYLNGNVYICGTFRTNQNRKKLFISEILSDGQTSWTHAYPSGDPDYDTDAATIQVDEEGNIYTLASSQEAGRRSYVLIKHRPSTPDPVWQRTGEKESGQQSGAGLTSPMIHPAAGTTSRRTSPAKAPSANALPAPTNRPHLSEPPRPRGGPPPEPPRPHVGPTMSEPRP